MSAIDPDRLLLDVTKASPYPVSEPLLIHLAVEGWYETNADEFAEAAIPEAGPYRASMAGRRCNRALAYAMAKAEHTEPVTIADKWRFALGTLIHGLIADGVKRKFPDTTDEQIDAVLDLRTIGIPGSGRGDLIFYTDVDGERVVIANEWKSKSPYAFKKAMGANNNSQPPAGPSFSDIVQGALAAAVVDADQLRIGYIGMEIISPGNAKKLGLKTDIDKFAAEWIFPRTVVDRLVANEAERVEMVLGFDNPGDVPRLLDDPEYLAGTVVVNPATKRTNTYDDDGTVIDTGTTWMCDYCPWRARCISDGQ